MPPLLDQLAVALLVAGALGFFAFRFHRKRTAGKSCGHCGGGTTKTAKVAK